MRWFFAIVFLLVAALPVRAQELRLGYREPADSTEIFDKRKKRCTAD